MIFLDIEIKEANGIEVGRDIRSRDVKVPIVYVTIVIMCFEVFFAGIYALKSSNGDDGIVIIGILCCFLFFNMAFMGLLREISEMYQYKYVMIYQQWKNYRVRIVKERKGIVKILENRWRDKRHIVSTKEQHEGMELNIIKAIVEKYNGVFDVNDTEEFFL